jgi:hypothetical protein
MQKIERRKERDLAELEALGATLEEKASLEMYYAKLIADEKDSIDEETNDKELERLLAKRDWERKEAKKEEELAQSVADAKVEIRANVSQLITQIAGKDSAVAKGVAVAQATISGYQGVQNAFTTASLSPITTVFPAYPFIQAGLAGAFSALQIKNILSSGKGGGSGPSGSGSGGGGSSSPSFNLVKGTGSNQISEGLQTQKQPLKAYVVSSDVSTGQEMDRRIVAGASL